MVFLCCVLFTAYFLAGNSGWHSMARKNKLKSQELYRKPYLK